MNGEPQYDIDPSRLPERLQPLAEEICTYFRELPRLLDEGQEGRVALIRGNDLIGLWDDMDTATEAGHDQFGLERFMTQPIARRDYEGLKPYFLSDPTRATA